MTDSGDRVTRGFISHPEVSDGKGDAGLAVSHDPDAREGECVRIEQVWPSIGDEPGTLEPVFVDEDDLGELIHELMGVHLEIMEENDD